MKIGVLGVGVVGLAVAMAFESSTINTVARFDKVEFNTVEHYENLLKSDIIFVCLPTPTIDGQQSIEILEKELKLLSESKYDGVVCIKSTVDPYRMGKIMEKFCSVTSYNRLKIAHNPEFLTAANPFSDFMKQKAICIASPDVFILRVVVDAYHTIFPGIQVYHSLNCIETAIAKYMRNCYLALKVTFANDFHELCRCYNANYDTVVEMFLSQGGIEGTHLKVPGPDGKYGYGGMCFPKDMAAMSSVMRYQAISDNIITAAEKANKKRRHFNNKCEEL